MVSRKEQSSIESKIIDTDRLNAKRKSGSALASSFHSKIGFGFTGLVKPINFMR